MGLWDVDEGIIAASFTNQGVMVDTKLHASPTTELDGSIGTNLVVCRHSLPQVETRENWLIWLVHPAMGQS